MVTRTFGRRAAGLLAGWLTFLLLAAGCGGGGSESTTLPLPDQATDAVRPWVTTDGPSFVDASGRPVVLRGVDVAVGAPAIYERAPQLGVNFARIFVAWSQVEPQPPTDGHHHFDER